jgi:hypothetical protein
MTEDKVRWVITGVLTIFNKIICVLYILILIIDNDIQIIFRLLRRI